MTNLDQDKICSWCKLNDKLCLAHKLYYMHYMAAIKMAIIELQSFLAQRGTSYKGIITGIVFMRSLINNIFHFNSSRKQGKTTF